MSASSSTKHFDPNAGPYSGQAMYQLLLEYLAVYPVEASYLEPLCHFLMAAEKPFVRSHLPGHITGSGILIQNHQILLIHHRYIKEWFQPGGHVDPFENPLQTAIRELQEETGWQTQAIATANNPLIPLDIDAHFIPANPIKSEPAHWHIDFAYLLAPVQLGQATDLELNQWFDLSEITATRLARVIKKYHALHLAAE